MRYMIRYMTTSAYGCWYQHTRAPKRSECGFTGATAAVPSAVPRTRTLSPPERRPQALTASLLGTLKKWCQVAEEAPSLTAGLGVALPLPHLRAFELRVCAEQSDGGAGLRGSLPRTSWGGPWLTFTESTRTHSHTPSLALQAR